jgi:hypothetical protein
MRTTTRIDMNTVITQVGGIVSGKIDDEIVMLSVEHEMYNGLDVVGSHIWELLAQPRSVSEVCETLLQEFHVDRETCQREVLAFLDNLYAHKVIHIVPPPPA